MRRRSIALLAGSLAVLVMAILAFYAGIGGSGQPMPISPTKPSAAAAPAKPAAPAASAAPAPQAVRGSGTINGIVRFTGRAPEMKVPAKRKEADVCKVKEVPYNAVIVNDGKLQDVFVRIAVGSVQGKFEASKTPAKVDQVDCMYSPRIQGVVSDQEVTIHNSDATLHNVHTFKGSDVLFNQAHPAKSDPLIKSWEDGIIKFTCDVHPWMRGFVVVTDHPFFAVSGADGSFTISQVPAGEYDIEAWHSHYGFKRGKAKVDDGKSAEVDFTYDGTEPEPDENKDELKGLW